MLEERKLSNLSGRELRRVGISSYQEFRNACFYLMKYRHVSVGSDGTVRDYPGSPFSDGDKPKVNLNDLFNAK